jgi:hypothetical protein
MTSKYFEVPEDYLKLCIRQLPENFEDFTEMLKGPGSANFEHLYNNEVYSVVRWSWGAKSRYTLFHIVPKSDTYHLDLKYMLEGFDGAFWNNLQRVLFTP